MTAPRSPVPREVSIELDRVVERWRQLPLDHALSYADRVRALTQSLADGVARAKGVGPSAVPDLGPATLMDQLTVMVYDAAEAATSSAPASAAVTVSGAASAPETAGLAGELARLRRELV